MLTIENVTLTYFEEGFIMERPFVAENTRERERLIALVARLTDEELSLPLEMG